MFRRETANNPRGNAKRAVAQFMALRRQGEGELLAWCRGTTGLGKHSGGVGIQPAVFAISGSAFYLGKGGRWVNAARVPLDAVAFAEVSLFRPGYVRLELVGRERPTTVLVLDADKYEPAAIDGKAADLLSNEPWIILSEKSAGRFLGLVGSTIRSHHEREVG